MKQFFSIIILAAFLSCSSSGRQAADTSKQVTAGADKRAQWVDALKDSVNKFQEQFDAIEIESKTVRGEFNLLLERFEVVTDPLYVEKYRVVRGWKDYDTTGKQGIISRVLEDGTIEIVATSNGDFNTITLSNGSETAVAGPVPAGDALHTTINGFTRVAFNNAGNVAEFVYRHSSEPLTLSFSNGKKFNLSKAQINMIADTYAFSLSEKRLSELDRQKTVIYNKLLLCRDKLAELEKTN